MEDSRSLSSYNTMGLSKVQVCITKRYKFDITVVAKSRKKNLFGRGTWCTFCSAVTNLLQGFTCTLLLAYCASAAVKCLCISKKAAEENEFDVRVPYGLYVKQLRVRLSTLEIFPARDS